MCLDFLYRGFGKPVALVGEKNKYVSTSHTRKVRNLLSKTNKNYDLTCIIAQAT